MALNAMATRFELVLNGENPTRMRGAGEEAFREIERLESQLSLYRPTSVIARVNSAAAREPVQVSPAVFQLLQLAQQLHRETDGAFDIAVAPLVRCWGFMHGAGKLPTADELEKAREVSGMSHVLLDAKNHTVCFDREGVMLDLGAIGKGYAVDCAVEILREAGVTSALIHGGTSTVCGIGAPPGADGWNISIPRAENQTEGAATVTLRDNALSVSALWGKSFEANGKKYGHVIDPRVGHPVNNAIQSAVVLPSAKETDALSTALLVIGLDGHERIQNLRPEMLSMVMAPAEQNFQVNARGIKFPSSIGGV